MDRAYVVREEIVERYVRGELAEEEATAFEQFYLTDAETLDELDALLSLQEAGQAAFEPAEHSRLAREAEANPPFWRRWFRPALAPMHLAAYALLVAALCLSMLLGPQVEGPTEVSVLTLATQRSAGTPIILDADAASRPLVLAIPVPMFSEETFALTVTREDVQVLNVTGLKPDASGIVNTLVPPEALEPGRYDIELRSGGETFGRWRLLLGE